MSFTSSCALLIGVAAAQNPRFEWLNENSNQDQFENDWIEEADIDPDWNMGEVIMQNQQQDVWENDEANQMFNFNALDDEEWDGVNLMDTEDDTVYYGNADSGFNSDYFPQQTWDSGHIGGQGGFAQGKGKGKGFHQAPIQKGFHQGKGKGFHQAPQKGFHQAPQKGFHQAPQKGFHQAPQKGFHQAPQKGFHQAPQKGFHQAPQKGFHQAPQKGFHQGGHFQQGGFGQGSIPQPYLGQFDLGGYGYGFGGY